MPISFNTLWLPDCLPRSFIAEHNRTINPASLAKYFSYEQKQKVWKMRWVASIDQLPVHMLH